MLGLYSAKLIEKNYKLSFGTLSGVVKSADDLPISDLTITAYKNGKREKELKVNESKFLIKLHIGNYSLQYKRDGYQDIVKDVTILNGEINTSTLLIPIPKPITIRLTDKSGKPYENLSFMLKEDNEMYSKTLLNFDENGIAKTAELKSNLNYSLDLLNSMGVYINSNHISQMFLWRKFKYGASKDLEVGRFKLPGAKNYVDISLPKVVLTNSSGEYSSTPLNINNSQVTLIGQRLSISQDINFSMIGFKAFNFAQTNASELMIVNDDNGIPSKEPIFKTNEFFVGDLSTVEQFPLADFTKGHNPVRLKPGIYWIVCVFNNKNEIITPTLIHPSSENPLIYSQNSSEWIKSYGELEYFFIE